jgi:hypothetical protein
MASAFLTYAESTGEFPNGQFSQKNRRRARRDGLRFGEEGLTRNCRYATDAVFQMCHGKTGRKTQQTR